MEGLRHCIFVNSKILHNNLTRQQLFILAWILRREIYEGVNANCTVGAPMVHHVNAIARDTKLLQVKKRYNCISYFYFSVCRSTHITHYLQKHTLQYISLIWVVMVNCKKLGQHEGLLSVTIKI